MERDGGAGEERDLGPGNQMAIELPSGSWRFRLTGPCGELTVPVRIDRLGFWDGRCDTPQDGVSHPRNFENCHTNSYSPSPRGLRLLILSIHLFLLIYYGIHQIR